MQNFQGGPFWFSLEQFPDPDSILFFPRSSQCEPYDFTWPSSYIPMIYRLSQFFKYIKKGYEANVRLTFIYL